ncbi:CRISPR-associated endonuclease Cas2 [Desulfurococcus mucosus]|uniref:CRISPR-associated endoribonuclease Cas2 n=1 Tax=Desulfurococcus mucosus (strain ATCC 35584 / DSM 2162 / JCM 9187 / O7/1) TaxID=765177 RepID=E8R9W7_DESM0|nr:CRISPR-associated endonuclease Cas2 [Desulfurococcus mucosus]ADV65293.1 CRISPR-associated protein, Cas2 family [Desulfurococcus mucosus DSM 2162]
MMVLVVYDIADNGLRTRIAEVLKDHGLTRIQKSAFIGDLTPQERETLAEKLSRLQLDETDRIDIFPICERDLKMHILVRRGLVERKLATR